MIQARKAGMRQKLFALWMVLTFLWVSMIALQLPTREQASRLAETASDSPEQACAKATADERKGCIGIFKMVAAAKWPPRLAQYTDTEQLELMFVPPLWVLAFGGIVALFVRGGRRPPPT
jgi:hypothetical protein